MWRQSVYLEDARNRTPAHTLDPAAGVESASARRREGLSTILRQRSTRGARRDRLHVVPCGIVAGQCDFATRLNRISGGLGNRCSDRGPSRTTLGQSYGTLSDRFVRADQRLETVGRYRGNQGPHSGKQPSIRTSLPGTRVRCGSRRPVVPHIGLCADHADPIDRTRQSPGRPRRFDTAVAARAGPRCRFAHGGRYPRTRMSGETP
jgi:hypothetical protein